MWEDDTCMRISCPSLSFFLSLCLYIFIRVCMHMHMYTVVIVRENMFPVVFFGYFFPPTDSNGTYSWQTLRVHRGRQEWLNPPSLLQAWNVWYGFLCRWAFITCFLNIIMFFLSKIYPLKFSCMYTMYLNYPYPELCPTSLWTSPSQLHVLQKLLLLPTESHWWGPDVA